MFFVCTFFMILQPIHRNASKFQLTSSVLNNAGRNESNKKALFWNVSFVLLINFRFLTFNKGQINFYRGWFYSLFCNSKIFRINFNSNKVSFIFLAITPISPDIPVENKATDKQIKKIFAMGHTLNMGKEELEEEAFKVTSIDKLSQLSKSQASNLIDDLSAMEDLVRLYG